MKTVQTPRNTKLAPAPVVPVKRSKPAPAPAPVKRSKPAPAESPEHLRAVKAGATLIEAVKTYNLASAEATKHPRSSAAREAVAVAEIALGKAKARAKVTKEAEARRDGPITPAPAPGIPKKKIK